jgi:apolipoprotein N-acyltransferase
MNGKILIVLSVCGGILIGLAWTDWCPGIILLCSFVPFFLIENHLYENPERYYPYACFLYVLPGFFIFSIITIGWIRAISMTAALCVILTVSSLMSCTVWLAHRIRLREGTLPGYVFLLSLWLSLEFLCLNIPVLSPWLNLGNGLSKDILFIQWYEATGTSGGTLWILLSNLFLARFIISLSDNYRKRLIHLAIWLSILIIPSAISVLRFLTIKASSHPTEEVVIVQPNIDPFGEKFAVPFILQLRKVISMADSAVTVNTRWIITPETTISDPVDENNLDENIYIKTIRDFSVKWPSANFMTGMVTYRDRSGEKVRESSSDMLYYNSAMNIQPDSAIEIYHKSKLVPGFEFTPSGGLFRLISRILPELGDSNISYSTHKNRKTFNTSDNSDKIAPVICYESVFGNFVTDFIKEGAGAIFIITNDGWWKNTNGYKQHLSYASLRAIETRRPVIRAANTGVSGIIDIRGKIIMRTGWLTSDVVNGTFSYEDRLTPYVIYGDYLLYTGCLISALTLIMTFVIRPFIIK